MKDLRTGFKHAGYNSEELYFEKVNQRLISELKEKKTRGSHLRLVVNNKSSSQSAESPSTPRVSGDFKKVA
jgi:hypothetical protein